MKYEEMDDLVDDTLLNPDYDPEADALPEGGIDELMAFMDEDEDEPADDFGFPDSEVTKGNLIVGEDITKSQPGPMDVHTAVGMFDAKKKKRKKIGKSFDEIMKAKSKSGYGPGKNPNSHKTRLGTTSARDKKVMAQAKEIGRNTTFTDYYGKKGNNAERFKNSSRQALVSARDAMKAARESKKDGNLGATSHYTNVARDFVRLARHRGSQGLKRTEGANLFHAARQRQKSGDWGSGDLHAKARVTKLFDEIFKARAKSGYAPGKNPNSHKKKALGGLAGTAKDRMKESEEAASIIEGGFASNGRRREVGFAPKGHDSLSEWKNTDKGGKKTYIVHPDQFAPISPKNRIDRRNATANRLASKAASKESNSHKAEMRANSVRDMLNTARQRMTEARAIRDQIKSGQTYGIPVSQLKAKMSNNVQQARYFTRGARLETNR